MYFSRYSPDGRHLKAAILLHWKKMADSFYKLEDEAFPSFLGRSLDNTSGRATLGNVTLGSGPGLPVAASTVAKIRPGCDNRWEHVS